MDGTGACPFTFSMQLPIRNLAVARGLEQDGGSGITTAWFVLCVHDANPDIAGQWRKWQRILSGQIHGPVAARVRCRICRVGRGVRRMGKVDGRQVSALINCLRGPWLSGVSTEKLGDDGSHGRNNPGVSARPLQHACFAVSPGELPGTVSNLGMGRSKCNPLTGKRSAKG